VPWPSERVPVMRRGRRFWLHLRMLGWVIALLAGCSSGGQGGQAAQAPVPVNAGPVVQRDVPVQVRGIGNVEAYSTVTVKSQVDGELAEIKFQAGQEVHEGDLLFVIDPRPFEVASRQAEANLAKDRAEATNARVQAERYQRLLANSFVSKDQYDQMRTQAEALEAAVKADTAGVESAKLQLEYCYIRAPFTGRIGQYLLHVGNTVKIRDTTLATINRIRPVYVSFSVPEQRLTEIRSSAATHDLKVQAFVGADEEHSAVGELSFIDNAVDTKTGTVLLKGTFPNQDEMLWPGQFVTVTLTLRTQPNALLVPVAAIQVGQVGQYVFVVGPDHTAQVRPVVTGMSLNEEVVVEKGLQLGEDVVTRGQVRLAPGSKLEVKSGLGADDQPGGDGK